MPAFNESLVIGSVVLQTRKYVDHVIVINDGSTDETAEIARLSGAEVVDMPENVGKAHAMMAGFKRAKMLGYSVVVMFDGDGQHNPHDIPAVSAPVLSGEADVVIGSRFLNIEAKIPTYRIAGQKILNGFTNATCNFKTTDSQSGFRALNKYALDHLTFSSEGYNLESDMLSHFSDCKLKITEVPIHVRYDVPHKHKMNPLAHGLGVFTRLVGMIGYRRPLLSFGVPGFAFFTVGFLMEIYTFSTFVGIGQFNYILFTGGIALLTLGLLLLVCGLILNSLVILMKDGNKRGGV
ncbi:hypothetical protein RJ53_01630 [Methanocalculus chunghsingensis]|uniref:Glycosyltransferase 2-like domain-containing protein n=1 Tax=Methanocalculus chunghsingensis TaxID=156457 RepID=A0A8J8B4N5_9EURY|nr:hypothetical protein [Methanocalculus chunghsingensis]